MHGKLYLDGPLVWFLAAVGALTLALALFVLADAAFGRRREALSRVSEPGWLYAVVEAAFLVSFAAGRFAAAPGWVRTASLVFAPVSLFASVAYLLRAVFPKPPAGAASAPDEDPAGS